MPATNANDREMQTDEDKNLVEQAQKALCMIAEHRNSTTLHTFQRTGQIVKSELDPAEAYSKLGIDDRTIDDEVRLDCLYSFH